jgi:hypothetical protein
MILGISLIVFAIMLLVIDAARKKQKVDFWEIIIIVFAIFKGVLMFILKLFLILGAGSIISSAKEKYWDNK